jgi:hypothetical protein
MHPAQPQPGRAVDAGTGQAQFRPLADAGRDHDGRALVRVQRIADRRAGEAGQRRFGVERQEEVAREFERHDRRARGADHRFDRGRVRPGAAFAVEERLHEGRGPRFGHPVDGAGPRQGREDRREGGVVAGLGGVGKGGGGGHQKVSISTRVASIRRSVSVSASAMARASWARKASIRAPAIPAARAASRTAIAIARSRSRPTTSP